MQRKMERDDELHITEQIVCSAMSRSNDCDDVDVEKGQRYSL